MIETEFYDKDGNRVDRCLGDFLRSEDEVPPEAKAWYDELRSRIDPAKARKLWGDCRQT